jgi:lysozyme
MVISQKGLAIIKEFEGEKLYPYLDQVGVPTIGYGTTWYPNGQKVTMKDPHITVEQANEYLENAADVIAKEITPMVTASLNQNQIDSLISFAYNLGTGALHSSTLLKVINKDPGNPEIRDEFNKWVYAGSHVLSDLVHRRKEEADLYFTPIS